MTTITLNSTMSLGRVLQLFRQMADIDQTDMGHRIGVSRPTISAWERDTREPSFSQVVAWASITGQPLDALVQAAAETTDQKVGSSSLSGRTTSIDVEFWRIVGRQVSPDTEMTFPVGVAR